MLHNYKIEGFAFNLRPLAIEDSQFVISLRSDPDLSKFLNPISGKLCDQIRWVEEYLEREGDYCFIVEGCGGAPEGMISVYDVNDTVGEWGRWILRKGSMAALESVIMLYEFSFNVLGLREVYCRTVKDNMSVVEFHNSCGLVCQDGPMQEVELRGQVFSMVTHSLNKEIWKNMLPAMRKKAERLSKKFQN